MMDEQLESVLSRLEYVVPAANKILYLRYKTSRLQVQKATSIYDALCGCNDPPVRIVLRMQLRPEGQYDNILLFARHILQEIKDKERPDQVKGLCEISLAFDNCRKSNPNSDVYSFCSTAVNEIILGYLRNPNIEEEILSTCSLLSLAKKTRIPESIRDLARQYPFSNSILASDVWTDSLQGKNRWDFEISQLNISYPKNRFSQN